MGCRAEAPWAALRLGILAVIALGAVPALFGLWYPGHAAQELSFTQIPALRMQPASLQARSAEARKGIVSRIPMRAEAAASDVAVEEEEEEDEEIEELVTVDEGYDESAYADYAYDEEPSQAWFDRRKIDRHKVNMVFFDMYKKPKKFFPHDLRPGDSIRVWYLEPDPKSGKIWYPSIATRSDAGEPFRYTDNPKLRETKVEGVILNIKGGYQMRNIKIQAIVPKARGAVGFEMSIPMHSPLVQRIEVLRRGYIGRNKNAYFLRGMIGKKYRLPIDEKRAALDIKYQVLRDEFREDEIPEPEYPQTQNERYPWPKWKQDQDDWDESQYDPEKVDQRDDYERRVIAQFRKRQKFKRGFYVSKPHSKR